MVAMCWLLRCLGKQDRYRSELPGPKDQLDVILRAFASDHMGPLVVDSLPFAKEFMEKMLKMPAIDLQKYGECEAFFESFVEESKVRKKPGNRLLVLQKSFCDTFVKGLLCF